jgi:hypothetical protein
MAAATIAFPFERGRLYFMRELRAFEAELLTARQRDRELTKLLRDPRRSAPGWMGLRNKELVPLKLFANHMCLSDDDQFLLTAEGDPVDAQITTVSGTLSLQLTLAAPIWGDGTGAQQNSGYQQHQIMVALNENECVIGYPPFAYENGVAIGEIGAISNEDRDRACRSGLASAIANKASHDGNGCILVVFAQDFYAQLSDVTLLRNLVDTVLSEYSLSFDSVCVFDSQPGFFVEMPPVRC